MKNELVAQLANKLPLVKGSRPEAPASHQKDFRVDYRTSVTSFIEFRGGPVST